MNELNLEARLMEWMHTAVSHLIDTTLQRGHAAWCDQDYDFVCPSNTNYPFQWFCDSCFHAIVLSHLDPVRAESELTSLLANQQPSGLVPHVAFWQREAFEERLGDYSIAYRPPYFSDCMQPPLLAEAVAAVAARGRGEPFLREVLPAVRRYFDWLHDVRAPDDDGLVALLQAAQTGPDRAPKFHGYLRGPRGKPPVCDPA